MTLAAISSLFGKTAYGLVDSSVTSPLTRVYDAWGDVHKFKLDGVIPCDDTTGFPTEMTVTATNSSTFTQSLVNGATALITTDTAEYDGINAQAKGSMFQCVANKPWYFGASLTSDEATQNDLLVGMCSVDTTLLASSTAHAIALVTGAFFSKLDGATTTYAKTYVSSAETNTAVADTLTTSTIIYEIVWDGTKLNFFIDGALVATFTASLPTAVLTPSVAFLTGTTAAKTLTINWMRAFMINS